MASSTARAVTVCVINRNGEDYLPASLGALVRRAGEIAEILLVDDASDDGSVELVQQSFPAIRVVRLAANLGPAAARNVALREARTDRVLLLDNDVSLGDGCLAALSRALDCHPDAAVAMPVVLYAHRPDTMQYDGADCHFLGTQVIHGDGVPAADRSPTVRPIGSLITACCLVDRPRVPAGLTFDESFFIYFEDHDFGVRLRAAGRGILSVGEARCLHGAGTKGLSIRHLGRYARRRVFFLIRNRWQFVLKTYSRRTLVMLAPILAVYELAQLAVVARNGWWREWWRAVAWVATHAGEIRAKRRAVQAARTVPDRVLLRGGPLPFRPELLAGRLARASKRMLDGVSGGYWRLAERWL